MGCTPGASKGTGCSQKRSARSIRSIRAANWQCSICTRAKIEHCQLNSRPFKAAISGIDRGRRPPEASIFYIFYFRNFCAHDFRTGVTYWASGKAVEIATNRPPVAYIPSQVLPLAKLPAVVLVIYFDPPRSAGLAPCAVKMHRSVSMGAR